MKRSTSDTRLRVALASWAAVALAIAPVSALAFQDAIPDEAELGLPPEFPTVEKIMDQAVKNIGVRYNLNTAQLEKTGDLMRSRVKGFLREHHDEIWPVIRDLIAAQIDGRAPEDKAKVMRIPIPFVRDMGIKRIEAEIKKDGHSEVTMALFEKFRFTF